jgi:aspartyl-tRNA(Asn)/glutamyl-tRNA(Gln) amidotransferase subunit A
MDIQKLTIETAHKGLSNKDFSAKELAEGYLKVIQTKNSLLNSYLEVYDDVMAQAQIADKRIQQGQIDILTGIPMAVKDNILIKARISSAGSKMLQNYRASYNATVIERLESKGVIFLGRTNMDEFAMGSSTEHSAFMKTQNPYDKERVPGGSSGGSAVAVAMDGATFALGSDTGGSIRQPACFCGVVGLKPTYGAVSRFGLIAMGSSLDHIGPITKSVSDAQIIFNAIKGKDSMDSTTLPDFFYEHDNGMDSARGLTVGVPRKFLNQGVDSDVLDNFESILRVLRKRGIVVRDVDLPNLQYALPCYYIIMPAEVSSNLGRYDGVRYGKSFNSEDLFNDYAHTRGKYFGEEVRRRIMLGTYILSHGYYDAYYRKALVVRRIIEDDFHRIFKSGVDALITPTTPTPAFKIGEKTKDPLKMYTADIFTVPANIAGIPAISVPSGFVERDSVSLPVGIQFMGAKCSEETLFALGKIVENI